MLFGMYDQTRMSGSIPMEHYSNQNQSEAAVAIDHDPCNQKRKTCQVVPAVSLDAGLLPLECLTRRLTLLAQLTGRMEAGHWN